MVINPRDQADERPRRAVLELAAEMIIINNPGYACIYSLVLNAPVNTKSCECYNTRIIMFTSLTN